MAFTTTNSRTASIRDRLVGTVDTIRGDIAKYREYRRTVNELSALTSRDLADLGIHRSMIQGIAREAAYGK